MIGDNSQVNNSVFNRSSLLDDIIQFVFSQQGNKLILVGDTAQLPPVGIVLSPALDINILNNSYSITSYEFEMTEVMRQSLDSGILTSATALRTKIKEQNTSLPFSILNLILRMLQLLKMQQLLRSYLFIHFLVILWKTLLLSAVQISKQIYITIKLETEY